mgnify:CR=1 FL=1
MERRYYLRGLGLGILITAIIMGAAQRGSKEMSDEEVRQRARELGMIENTVLSEPVAEPETDGTADVEQAETDAAAAQEEAAPADTEPVTEDAQEAAADEENSEEQSGAEDSQEQADAVEAQADAADAQTALEEETEQSTGAQSETKTAASGEAQIFTIDKGDSSVSVAQKLEQAGLISSASSYDRFLCDNGYDKKIRAGEYTIPADAGDEQIARIITGME